jgi:hypothetical protein
MAATYVGWDNREYEDPEMDGDDFEDPDDGDRYSHIHRCADCFRSFSCDGCGGTADSLLLCGCGEE